MDQQTGSWAVGLEVGMLVYRKVGLLDGKSLGLTESQSVQEKLSLLEGKLVGCIGNPMGG